VVSFSESVERIKGDLPAAVPPGLIRRLCGELEITGRQRLLTPVVTTYLMLLRALHAAPMAALPWFAAGVLPSDRPPAGRILRPVAASAGRAVSGGRTGPVEGPLERTPTLRDRRLQFFHARYA